MSDEPSGPIDAGQLEALAERLRVSVAPLRVGVAATAADLRAVFALRADEVRARGWQPREADVDDRDEHDPTAVHVAVWSEDQVIGACRLLLPAPDRLLPIEREFDLRLEPRGRVVQWGRLVLDRRFRGDPQHRLAMACLAGVWLETQRRGFEVCSGAVSAPILQMYHGLGWQFDVLGPARFVDGEERFPIKSTPATVRGVMKMLGRLLGQ